MRPAAVIAILTGLLLTTPAPGGNNPPPPTLPKLPPLGLPAGLPKLPKLPCTIKGSGGPNIIRATNRKPEIICGRGGRDRIYAGVGDIVLAGAGNDTIYSRNGRMNLIDGGAGIDRARVDRKLDARSSVERLF